MVELQGLVTQLRSSMAEKKQESFTVTDRRLFTSEGELRQESIEETSTKTEPAVLAEIKAAASDTKLSSPGEEQIPPPPTAAEQKVQADAYRKSARDLDARIELSGRSAKE